MTSLSLVLGAPTAVAQRPKDRAAADERLRRAQQVLLDPQTEPRAVASDEDVRAAQRTDQLRSRGSSLSSPQRLTSAVGGHWAYGRSLPAGFNAVHMVVGRGKILFVAGSGNDQDEFAAGTFSS
jgi:hypothetical protein